MLARTICNRFADRCAQADVEDLAGFQSLRGLCYAANNRLTGVSGGATASFVYDGDARDRLVDARTSLFGNGQYTQTFGYDLAGNIITRTANVLQAYLYRQPPAPPTLPPMPYKVFFPIIMRTGESYGVPPAATLHQPSLSEQPRALTQCSLCHQLPLLGCPKSNLSP